MIVFDLLCEAGAHRFEGWFASSDAFADQQARGLLCCPECGSARIAKAPMAPAVGRKGNQITPSTAADKPAPAMSGPIPPAMQQAMAKLAAMQAEALKSSTWVGDSFAEKSRAMHYGEAEHETIHGQTSLDEARALLEEGVAVMPLPFPVAPPDELN
ncbi:hypothetical protein B0I00_0723 [Novosphingobium kunmingense]|uniref:DUF1178 family protein n=1 Tax=Novosphingobium kunmingense TaxID=1211806 RepID=A0A2N0I2X8_9SPHN|nr:DUF1178 family protein [Novosphingobium kunmingense]PKB25521.1 hypothetical protein B0I00_0723 [Novosphingobium kunmingense]